MTDSFGCCPSNSHPKFDYKCPANGTIIQVGGRDCYIIGDSPKTIIYIYDVFGMYSGRVRELCDHMSTFGYTVIMPDPLLGDYMPEGGLDTFADWIKSKKPDDFLEYVANSLLPYLRSLGKTEFALAGSCYGVWICLHMCARFKELKACVGFHPSYRIENMLGGDPITLLNQVTQPHIIFPTHNDPDNIKPGGEYIEILQEKTGGKIEVYLMDNMIHGYVNRSDLSNLENLNAYLETLSHTKSFLAKYI